ncbi:hypothetical protein MBLNU230_g7995t1 [Neophaeotheca triangularis]
MAPSNVEALRTPDYRFKNIPDFPYTPKYLNHGNLRMAYIDERNDTPSPNQQPETFLCLHGQPTWSFLYRRMIPHFLTHTTHNTPPPRRVIAPDLLGFGRSDKPTLDATYTYNFHRDSLLHLLRTLDLQNITLVVQDWGGLLGLTLPLAEPTRFKRLLVMNTSIATGQPSTKGFDDWRAYNNRSPDMDVGALIGRGTKHLAPAETEAYNAPFPSVEYKGGVRRFPNLVMTDAGMEGVEVSKRSREMYGNGEVFGKDDVFVACGMKDPVLGPPVMRKLAQVWGNGCFWFEVAEGGHFVQEWGEEVAKKAIEAFERREAPQGVSRVAPPSSKL